LDVCLSVAEKKSFSESLDFEKKSLVWQRNVDLSCGERAGVYVADPLLESDVQDKEHPLWVLARIQIDPHFRYFCTISPNDDDL
jgi:hypothetical protein